MNTAKKHVIIIGAGIIGVSTALHLTRMGHRVTLLDKGEVGQGASYGNGGILAACAVVPVTSPGLISKAPFLLMDKEYPLFLRWSYLPKLFPWLMRYLSNANDRDTRRISKGLEYIATDTVEQHEKLAKGTKAERFLQKSTYSFAYKDKQAFEDEAYTWKLRREAGFEPELILGDKVQEIEPSLGKNITCLAMLKDHGFILSPGDYVAALAESFIEMGGEFIQCAVQDFTLEDGQIKSISTSKGELECDNCVITTGVWSKPLMRKLGINVPLEAERGYHIIYKNPNEMPNQPMMIASGKFVATPMSDGLRCAGIVEFGGLDPSLSKKPLELLRRHVKQTFPNLQAADEEEWLGFRPATSDSLPLIGELKKSGVYAGFGHQHIGLTTGPKTGAILAQMINGDHINQDVSAFDANRFS